MPMEHLELWIAMATLWATQIKLLFAMREIKAVIIIKKKGSFKKGLLSH